MVGEEKCQNKNEVDMNGWLLGACEICGLPAVMGVADLKMVDPEFGDDGSLYEWCEQTSEHFFCDIHQRMSKKEPLPEDHWAYNATEVQRRREEFLAKLKKGRE